MFEGSSFTPRWVEGPPRFAPWGGVERESPLPHDMAPAQEISLWDAGYAAGRAEALAEQTEAATHADRLAEALARLGPMPPVELAEALAAKVRALLRQLIGNAAVDEVLLGERCIMLAELANASHGARLFAHPDDAGLLSGKDYGLTIIGDAALPRGELRLVDGPAELAAGPLTMLENWGDEPC